MTANGLTKYLMKVFEPSGKQISASMLRHIYLTEKMGPIDEAKKSLSSALLFDFLVLVSAIAVPTINTKIQTAEIKYFIRFSSKEK